MQFDAVSRMGLCVQSGNLHRNIALNTSLEIVLLIFAMRTGLHSITPISVGLTDSESFLSKRAIWDLSKDCERDIPGDTRLPRSHMSPGSGREGRMFLGKHSSVGEAVVVGFAEDDVIEHPDAEDL